MTVSFKETIPLKAADEDDNALLLSQKQEQLQTIVINDNQIILSAYDEIDLYTPTGIAPDSTHAQFSLFAENIVLAQDFSANSALIAAHSITCKDNTVFDVSGLPGQDGYGDNGAKLSHASGAAASGAGVGGTSGGVDSITASLGSTSGAKLHSSLGAPQSQQPTDGGNGGDLSLYIESLDTTKSLVLRSNGGKGGNGVPGNASVAGGDAKDGGNGGCVNVFTVQPLVTWLDTLKNIATETNLDIQKQHLTTLQGEIPDTADNANLLKALAQAVAAQDQSTLSEQLESIGDHLQDQLSIWKARFNSNIEVQAGAGGTYGAGTPNGNSGVPGMVGQNSVTLVGEVGLPNSIPDQPFIFVHPSQCAMVLEKAKLGYMFLDPIKNPDIVASVTAQFNLIKTRTEPFVGIDSDSALAKFYAQHESEFGIVNGIDTLNSINAEAKKYLCYLQSGLDFYGYATNYVPLTSLTAITKDAVAVLVNSFTLLQDAYDKQFAQLEQAHADSAYISTARDQLSQQFAQIDVDMPQLKSTLESSSAIIDAFQAVLPGRKSAVDTAVNKYIDKLKTYFDFDMSTFLTSLGQVAFAPHESLVYLAQAGQLGYGGVTNISNVQGQPVKKEYLISEIRSVKSDVDAINEGYQSLDDGTLSLADAGGSRLLAEQDSLNSLLDSMYGKFDDSNKEDVEVRQAMKDYVTAVTSRNNQVLKYNAAINLILQYSQQQQNLLQQASALNDKVLANFSANVPGLTAFVSQAYYAARQELFRYMSLASRAYKFWCLDDTNLLNDSVANKTPPEINGAVISKIQDFFWTTYTDQLGKLGNGAEFPNNPDDLGPALSITGPAVDVFIATGQLLINVPLSTKETTTGLFVDMAGVRVTDVRVYLRGVTLKPDSTGASILPVDITHTGHEQIVNTANQVYSFVHEPVTRTFEYHVNDDSIYKPAAFEITAREDPNKDNNIALVGPYTYWHIKVNKQIPGLDLTKVTKIDIYFRGISWSYQDMNSTSSK